MPRAFPFFTVVTLLLACPTLARAQTESPEAHRKRGTHHAPHEKAGPDPWEFSISACYAFVPDNRNYIQPTVTADRDWLHLEGRYNYEALDTGSAWFGYNLRVGKKLSLDFTPMLGGVFGHTAGVAVGYEGTLSWWKLELYGEGEYLSDTSDSSDSYFYTWTQLSLAPVDWFSFGVVGQRTQVVETKRNIQRGFLFGLSYKQADLSIVVLNPDDSPSVLIDLSFAF